MIITRHKPVDEVLEAIGSARKIFLIGCSLCATTCKTGGEKDLEKVKKIFEEKGKEVVGSVVLDPACNMLEVKRFVRNSASDIEKADAIVSFACGGGTQAISEVLQEVRVYPGNDTLFQGEITRLTLKGGNFEQKCSLCGNCLLGETGGICVVTRCPKGLINGPCGGSKDGKCETDRNMDCVWMLVYKRLKERGEVDNIRRIRDPKDHSVNKNPQSLEI